MADQSFSSEAEKEKKKCEKLRKRGKTENVKKKDEKSKIDKSMAKKGNGKQ